MDLGLDKLTSNILTKIITMLSTIELSVKLYNLVNIGTNVVCFCKYS